MRARSKQPIRWGLVALAALWMMVIVPLSAAAAPYAALVMDARSGEVLHARNADTRLHPASLTKMMTLYMVFEAVKQGKITLDTKWTASSRVARQPASRLGLRRGEKITVRQAIYALITKSANDVATLVAESLAGRERDFALAMTAKARALGMSKTTFRNASGLGNRGQLSTARDMATLALALLRDFPNEYKLFSTTKFKWRDRTYKNHNKLLTSYEGTDGIKTGYIAAAGYNLVASVKRGDTRLIGVIFGGDSSRMRNRHMIKLLNKGFRILEESRMLVASADKGASTQDATSDQRTANTAPTDTKLAWGIQVGAFAKYSHAHRIASEAAAIVPNLLETGQVVVVPLDKKSGKRLYRSRIHGITRKQAYQACKVLEKRKHQCMELRVPADLQVAQAGG